MAVTAGVAALATVAATPVKHHQQVSTQPTHRANPQHRAQHQHVERCRSHRVGLLWYRHWENHWLDARGADTRDFRNLNDLSCAYVHYVVSVQAERAHAARVSYMKWKEAQKAQFSYHGGNSYVQLGQRLAAHYGWDSGYEWEALYTLWNEESGWDPHAYNPSGACGIPQDMGDCHGYDPVAQIEWGLRYIRSTYGDPATALGVKHTKGWY